MNAALGVGEKWPAPRWNYLDEDVVATHQQLFWEGELETAIDGDPGVLMSITVEVDELGHLLERTWLLEFRSRGTEEDAPAEWVLETPVCDELESLWARTASREWLEARRNMLEISITRLESYGSDILAIEPVLAERLRHMQVLRHAYDQDERVLPQAVRLAVDWAGSIEEFRATLPVVLA